VEEFTSEKAYGIARGRWFSVSELECILNTEKPLLNITGNPPSSPPQSGSLFLYDRSLTRNYKDDQHTWIKKRNSPKVREDHVKLRVDGKFRVAGCYVHCANTSTMHRRAYHLLDPSASENINGGTAGDGSPLPEPPKILNPNPFSSTSKAISSLVLVHYLDTQVAAEILAKMEVASAVNGTSKKVGRRRASRSPVRDRNNLAVSSGAATVKPKLTGEESLKLHVPPVAPQMNTMISQGTRPASTPWVDAFGPALSSQHTPLNGHSNGNNAMSSTFSPMRHVGELNSAAYLDNESFEDFLNMWQNSDTSMIDVQEESTPSGPSVHALRHPYGASAGHNYQGSDHTFTDLMTSIAASPMFGSHAPSVTPSDLSIGGRQHEFQQQRQSSHQSTSSWTSADVSMSSLPTPTPISVNASSIVPDATIYEVERVPSSITQEQHTCITESSMPPPELVLPNVVDVSPEEITYRGENKGTKVVVSFASAIESKKGWHRFLVFVDINREALTVEALHLSPATEINPYTFRCESPRVPIVGKRSVFLVGATDDDSSVTSSAICATLKSEWKKIVANMSNSNGSIMPTFFAWRRATGVCFLSQISEDTVQFNVVDQVGVLKVSAPGDIPSSESVLSQLSKGDSSNKSDEGNSCLPAPPAAMACIAGALSDFPHAHVHPLDESAMQNDMGMVKKRTANMIDSSNSVGSGPTSEIHDSVGAEVDRHCKIRFVEKLTQVIADAEEGDGVAGDSTWTIPSENIVESSSSKHGDDHHHRTNSGVVSNVEAFLDENQLNDVEDDQLDSLLDSLLIRIVEMLVEMSASDTELQQELNSPDKSGFTLLHYASLYNLQSLLPVLLSRGANADNPSLRGKLTPLHLACGAGNFAVVELLTRHGCAIEVIDSSGATPADHAIKNGFPEIALWLAEKSGKHFSDLEGNSAKLNVQKKGGKNRRKNTDDKFLLQSAFSSLSLKDKLAFNLMVKKGNFGNQQGSTNGHGYRRAKNLCSSKKSIQKETIPEGPSDDESLEDGNNSPDSLMDDNGNIVAMQVDNEKSESMENMLAKLNGEATVGSRETDEEDEHSIVSSCISESDRESLDVAMSLMNEGELNDLENSSKLMREDVRKWMLRHNYRSLKEATMFLQSSLKEKSEENMELERSPEHAIQYNGNDEKQNDMKDDDVQKKTKKKINTKQSLKNVKSQALASLVIRKNILGGRQVSASVKNADLKKQNSGDELNRGTT